MTGIKGRQEERTAFIWKQKNAKEANEILGEYAMRKAKAGFHGMVEQTNRSCGGKA
ncbi:hypothetical protein chiPu_0023734, partial [Chiloscyllium punctatum]|nr:hypothetical protein [Chiloscyllium punctatum]